jgi:hypothetical protein
LHSQLPQNIVNEDHKIFCTTHRCCPHGIIKVQMHNPHKLSCSPSPIVKKCYFMLVTLKACFTNQQRCGTKKFSHIHSTHHDLKCINIFHIQIPKPTIPEVHIYIGFETLKVKCTQYGICSQAAFKNARAMFFFLFLGRGAAILGRV